MAIIKVRIRNKSVSKFQDKIKKNRKADWKYFNNIPAVHKPHIDRTLFSHKTYSIGKDCIIRYEPVFRHESESSGYSFQSA